MEYDYTIVDNELTTLKELSNNHPDYYTRQRASLVLFCIQKNQSMDPNEIQTENPFSELVARFNHYGFCCLLPSWLMKQPRDRPYETLHY